MYSSAARFSLAGRRSAIGGVAEAAIYPGDLGSHTGDLHLLNLERYHDIGGITPRESLDRLGPSPGP